MTGRVFRNIIAPLLVLAALSGCEKSINDSGGLDRPTPGRRDYAWSVDTLPINSYDGLTRLWGSSRSDVWGAGTAGLWHYDGFWWHQYGHFSGLDWSGMMGFSSTDIWAITSVPGRIYHYDANGWAMETEVRVPGYSMTYLSAIWGDAPSNVFVAGAVGNPNTSPRAIILHYDGVNWNIMSIPNIQSSFNAMVRDARGDGAFYLRGMEVLFDTTTHPTTVRTSDKLYKYDGQFAIHEIDNPTGGYPLLAEINGSAYVSFSGQSGIWKCVNNRLELWKDFTTTGYSIGTMKGHSALDIFCWSSRNSNSSRSIIMHYNGSDIAPLFESDNVSNFGLIDKDLFVIIHGSATYIARGRLPE